MKYAKITIKKDIFLNSLLFYETFYCLERSLYMIVCGVVVEYNPFHNGHHYHLQQARLKSQCDCLIAIMSTHFVQRGEPAVAFAKDRVQCALQHGADIVIELPYPYNVQSADYFAYGAIESLKLMEIDTLVFGSESNDIEQLQIDAFQSVEKPTTQSLASSSKGLSNDILAHAYLRAIANTNITPISIQRTNQYHDQSVQHTISSASAIRKAYFDGQDVSHTTPMHEHLIPLNWEHYYPYLRSLLCTHRPQQLSQLFLCDEGIEYLLIKNAQKYANYHDFLNACTSSKYTKSRIQRCLVHILAQCSKEEANACPIDCVRVLGFNDIGRKYLSQLRHQKIAVKFAQLSPWRQALALAQAHAYGIGLNETQRKELLKWESSSAFYLSSL